MHAAAFARGSDSDAPSNSEQRQTTEHNKILEENSEWMQNAIRQPESSNEVEKQEREKEERKRRRIQRVQRATGRTK
jgi:hypothetical protein